MSAPERWKLICIEENLSGVQSQANNKRIDPFSTLALPSTKGTQGHRGGSRHGGAPQADGLDFSTLNGTRTKPRTDCVFNNLCAQTFYRIISLNRKIQEPRQRLQSLPVWNPSKQQSLPILTGCEPLKFESEVSQSIRTQLFNRLGHSFLFRASCWHQPCGLFKNRG